MNKISARIIALLLCASTSAVVFSACAKDDGPKKTVDPTVTKENNTKEPTFEDTSEYDGQKFTILQAHDGSNKAENFHDTYIACEERTGEPINDAVIDRNEKVFEKYGVTIEKRQGGAGDAATAAKSGTVDFEMVYDWGIRQTTNAMDGYYYDFQQIPYIDLTQSYWAPSAQETLKIADKTLITTCDISMNRIGYAYFVIFNKGILDQFKVEYPYSYIENNTWTVDNYLAIAQQCKSDVNGDTVMDEEDMFGASPSISGLAGWAGCGGNGLVKNEDGTYSLNVYTDLLRNIYAKYNEDLATNQAYPHENLDFLNGRDWSQYDNQWQANRVISFGENHFALDSTTMQYISELSAVKGLNYGIAPNPKINEDQEHYYHSIDTCAPMFAVMKNADMDKVGIILEYLTYQSEQYLLPAYYEKTIKTNQLWDDRDAVSADIIRDNVYYSWTGLYYLNIKNAEDDGWDPIGTMLGEMCASGNFASVYKKYADAAQTSIDKFYDKVLEIDVNK